MYHLDADRSQTFGFPMSFRVLVWGFLALCVALLLVFIAMGIFFRDRQSMVYLIAACGVIPFTGIIAALRTIPHLGDRLRINDRGITYEPARAEPMALAWNEVAALRDLPHLQRLELHGTDGFSVIRLDYQVEQFDALRQVVLERVDWARIDDHADSVMRLPATFSPSLSIRIIHAVFAAGFGGAAVATCLSGQWAGLVLLPLACLWLLDWYALRVEHDQIVIAYPFRTKVVSADDIAEVVMTSFTHKEHGVAESQLPVVKLRLKSGKEVMLGTAKGGAIRLYQTVRLLTTNRLAG